MCVDHVVVRHVFTFNYRETYLNSYLIGEGMSGFIPAIVALIQGRE